MPQIQSCIICSLGPEAPTASGPSPLLLGSRSGKSQVYADTDQGETVSEPNKHMKSSKQPKYHKKSSITKSVSRISQTSSICTHIPFIVPLHIRGNWGVDPRCAPNVQKPWNYVSTILRAKLFPFWELSPKLFKTTILTTFISTRAQLHTKPLTFIRYNTDIHNHSVNGHGQLTKVVWIH